MNRPVVVVAGRPNVGKSTLVNRIVGRRAAIVEERPGVTRDRLRLDANWAGRNRTLLVGFLRALRKGTDYMFAHPDQSAELGARELRTTPENARRALEDSVRMDVIARDLSLSDLSLQRVFETMEDAEVIGRNLVYDRGKFVDESYLSESRR